MKPNERAALVAAIAECRMYRDAIKRGLERARTDRETYAAMGPLSPDEAQDNQVRLLNRLEWRDSMLSGLESLLNNE